VQPARLAGIDGGIFRKLRLLQKVIPAILKRRQKFDVIYPFPIDRQAKETVCWIPDLQEKHFPELFDPAELKARDEQVRYYFENFQHVVFSSESARSDFHRFYPEATCQTHVVHFAVFNPITSKITPLEIRAKYRLPERFFYCPNQFWVHKNHKVVIKEGSRKGSVGVDPAHPGRREEDCVRAHLLQALLYIPLATQIHPLGAGRYELTALLLQASRPP
jgi:hypothetical protein